MSKIVIGGGIGGLSAAYYLRKKFPEKAITLIEATSRVGGWIKSNKVGDTLFEMGPHTIRPRGPTGINALDLVEELNLAQNVLPLTAKHPAVTNRMIYVNGKLHKLPSNFTSLFKTHSPFTKPLAYYLLKEITRPKKVIKSNDESIYDFVNRRLGKEIADYAIAPLIAGICAGDAREVSVKQLMDQMFQYEQQYGSITAGVVRSVLFDRRSSSYKGAGQLHSLAKKDKWMIYTLKNGLESLPRRLSQTIEDNGVDVLLNSTCSAIEIRDNTVTVHANNKLLADHLVSGLPAHVLSTVLKGHPKLSLLLQKIPYVTVGVVNLQYDGKLLDTEGFGFLIPPKEKLPVLGVIYDSCCAPVGEGTVLTVMMGGRWFDEYFGHNPSKEHLLEVATTQVCKSLRIEQPPRKYLVNILQNCIPQYLVGHNDLLKEINNYVKSRKLPLTLCGGSYTGSGINDVIWRSKIAVDNLQ